MLLQQLVTSLLICASYVYCIWQTRKDWAFKTPLIWMILPYGFHKLLILWGEQFRFLFTQLFFSSGIKKWYVHFTIALGTVLVKIGLMDVHFIGSPCLFRCFFPPFKIRLARFWRNVFYFSTYGNFPKNLLTRNFPDSVNLNTLRGFSPSYFLFINIC